MYPLLFLLLLPLAGFACSFQLGKGRWATWIPISTFAVALLGSAVLLFEGYEAALTFTWVGDLRLGFGAGPESLSLSLLACFLTLVVALYAMETRKGRAEDGIRLLRWLSFFLFAFQGFLFSRDLLSLLGFMELVGVSSLCLIGHERDRRHDVSVSRRVYILNRATDCGLLIALAFIYADSGSLLLDDLSPLDPGNPLHVAVGWVLLLAAFGKSAQFPFCFWLPRSMIAPLPASALLHGVTLVSTGALLVVKVLPILCEQHLQGLVVVGGFTALIGSLSALRHFHLKKILAYSTISQGGLVFLILGLGSGGLGLAHLWVHAFAKAGLFLCLGVLIISPRSSAGLALKRYDLRSLSGLNPPFTVSYFLFWVFGLSLAGILPFSGFFSKAAVMEWLSEYHWSLQFVVGAVMLLTYAYLLRIFVLLFHGVNRERAAGAGSMLAGGYLRFTLLGFMALGCIFYPIHARIFAPFANAVDSVLSGGMFQVSSWLSALAFIALGLAMFLFLRGRRPGFSLLRPLELLTKYLSTFWERTGPEAVLWVLVPRGFSRVSAWAGTFDRQVLLNTGDFLFVLGVLASRLLAWGEGCAASFLFPTMGHVAIGLGRFMRFLQGRHPQRYFFAIILFLLLLLLWYLGEINPARSE